MTPVEMCHLAAFLASKYPSARVQESSSQFWQALLAEVDDTDALFAFIRLVRCQSDVALADIADEAHRIQAERLARYPESGTDLNQTRHYRTAFPAVLTSLPGLCPSRQRHPVAEYPRPPGPPYRRGTCRSDGAIRERPDSLVWGVNSR